MKLYTKVVSKCVECPHMKREKWGSAIVGYKCWGVNPGREVALLVIPDWCPLPDKKG